MPVLLVLRHQAVHVALSLGELYPIHTASAHQCGKALLNMALNCSDVSRNSSWVPVVTDEGGGHFSPLGQDVTDSCLPVVGHPFDKTAAALVVDDKHWLVRLLHAAPEHGGGHGQGAAVAKVTSHHPAPGIEWLLSGLGHHQCPVLLAALAGEERQWPLWWSCQEQFAVGRSQVTQGCQLRGEEPSAHSICTHLPPLTSETPESVPPDPDLDSPHVSQGQIKRKLFFFFSHKPAPPPIS